MTSRDNLTGHWRSVKEIASNQFDGDTDEKGEPASLRGIWVYVKYIPVGWPLYGLTISFKGPPEACTTGITSAAYHNGRRYEANNSFIYQRPDYPPYIRPH